MFAKFTKKCTDWVSQKTELDAENLSDIRHLGAFYAIELFCYYLFLVGKTDGFEEGKWLQHIGTISLEQFAYIVGGLVFGLSANKFGVRLVLKYATYLSALGSFLLSFLLLCNLLECPTEWCYNYVDTTAKVLFGLGFSAGIGLIYTLIVEKFHRYKRTWATALVCTIGFLGPLVSVVSVWLTKIISQSEQHDKDFLCIPFFIGGCLTCFINRNRYIPLEASIRVVEKYYGRAHMNIARSYWHYLTKDLTKEIVSFLKSIFFPITKNNQRNETALKFWNCILMGISVQYFVFLVQHIDALPFYNGLKKEYYGLPINNIGLFVRAFGVIIGTIVIADYSKKERRRRSIIIITLWVQFFAFVIFFAPNFTTILPQTLCISVATLLIGMTNGVWFLLLLQTAEQFSIAERPVMTTLVPNVYRASTLLLIVLNTIPNVATFNVHKDFLINQPFSLIAWGVFFMILSIHGTNSLVDNFEGDALYIDEESNKSIVTSELRHQIAAISPNIIVAEDIKQYLKKINELIFKHFQKELKEHFFFNNIFYFDRHNLVELGSTLSQKDKEHYNKSAYDRYDIKIDDPTRFHTVSKQLVNENVCISLSKWVASEKSVSGIILWRSAKGQELNADEKPEYRESKEGNTCYAVLDLSTIIVPDIERYRPLVKDNLTLEETRVLLSELVEKAQFDTEKFEKAFLINARTEGVFVNKLKANILLHRLDADDYPQGSYYSYFLKPYTSLERLQGILFIKTIVPLKRHRMGQLRDLITIVMLQRADELLKRTNEMILDEDNHSKRHEIKIIRKEITELEIATNRKDQDTALSHIKKIDAIISHVDNLTDINYILMKTAPKKVITSKHKNWDIVENKPINLKKELSNTIDLVTHSIDALRISNKQHKLNLVKKILPKLKTALNASVPENIEITVLVDAFKVVLAELLKNATFYTDSVNPELTIRFIRNEAGNYELHFCNNVALNMKAFEYIQNGTESEKGMKAHTRGGIRTIKRYLRFTNFNYVTPKDKNKDRWALAAKEPIQGENSTDIYLIIPKSDVKELII